MHKKKKLNKLQFLSLRAWALVFPPLLVLTDFESLKMIRYMYLSQSLFDDKYREIFEIFSETKKAGLYLLCYQTLLFCDAFTRFNKVHGHTLEYKVDREINFKNWKEGDELQEICPHFYEVQINSSNFLITYSKLYVNYSDVKELAIFIAHFFSFTFADSAHKDMATLLSSSSSITANKTSGCFRSLYFQSCRLFGRKASAKTDQNQYNYTKPSVPCIDVHTHMYLPRYMDLLRSRSSVPKIIVNAKNGEDRLVILPNEDENKQTSVGRPVGGQYFDIHRKLAFMDTHNIETSVISLANPWLDFLGVENEDMCIQYARLLNEDFETLSTKHPNRVYGLGVLPTQLSTVSRTVDACCAEIDYIGSHLPHVRGIILVTIIITMIIIIIIIIIIIGTHGIGKGLDDKNMLALYQSLERNDLLLFIHPHYGAGNEFYTGYGHALYLALGFTFETTIAISRLILSGLLDSCPNLKLLLAHAGGTLPYLIGRLNSCALHDHELDHLQLQNDNADNLLIQKYLKRFYFDGITYNELTLKCLQDMVGDRILFGTDHPFFPPYYLSHTNKEIDTTPWPSTTTNQLAVKKAFEGNETEKKILRNNAIHCLGLDKKIYGDKIANFCTIILDFVTYSFDASRIIDFFMRQSNLEAIQKQNYNSMKNIQPKRLSKKGVVPFFKIFFSLIFLLFLFLEQITQSKLLTLK
ncbi:hypothetical protein RFI_01620 [Reticulomyxa filosa]|uniref:Amidohydrolase-related domain-containing protein n=1 Tax=Reticulomyxa filosa TaxID=46433 RepID=X6PBL4_RETFI|nr:hypothetical protein RFI_01620 [Reticulomyxa filosa]|eukprot:ETO35444.1 hypothetical protein RFI_01620 [Reticulomyxa filosa]